MESINPTSTSSWKELESHFTEIESVHLRDLFASDPKRFEKFSLECEELLFDYSKNRINQRTIDLLVSLAKECKLEDAIKEMFSGEKINSTENRAVLHTALRNFSDKSVFMDGQDVMPVIKKELEHIKEFSEKLISGKFKGFTGKKIQQVINIGIGGSDLGPAMVTSALKPYTVGPKVTFVSNIDGSALAEALEGCDAERTLFVVVSKTFTTQETMTNAESAKNWLLESLGSSKAIANHFVAVSTNAEKVEKFGINTENQFYFWDWVGGRYSLWSSVGLSVALQIGYENFENLLKGAFEADEHFENTNFNQNIPVLMGMLGIWYNNFFKSESQAVLPYSQSLSRLPAYLQQADMESNGKSIDRSGEKILYQTGPIIWGEPGTNGQHAFYQLIHQGTKLIPCDFIGVVNSSTNFSSHQTKLFSNFIAQSEALMKGKTSSEVKSDLADLEPKIAAELEPYKVFKGNIPTNSLVLDKLTPFNLGKLIAFYEHKIFVQGVIWNVYSFDQWGVELGKVLARTVVKELESSQSEKQHDSSTNGLMNRFKSVKNQTEI